ncbi:sensor histidine kinase [Streptacidiphilus sp. N1-3]|uniref:histidine kinase n=1 Tax=Streptacidiphilus alkalitolerans TaxID=3342712 RepID=A0ABV6X6P4_9ACTN
MSLRGRLSVLTAAAVAVAIAVCSFSCWFIVRNQLYTQARATLSNAQLPMTFDLASCRDSASASAAVNSTNTSTNPTFAPKTSRNHGQSTYLVVQLMAPAASGQTVCVQGLSTVGVNIAPGDMDYGPDVIRNGTYTDGSPALVRVTTVTNRETGTLATVLVAYPLKNIQEPLRTLLLILSGIAVAGALGAAGIGLLVARAALKPVDKLTAAVEHIAQTEELGTTITVTGKDEIARLSESFNSMSTALASSRDRQSQLIADAGHELRTPLTSLRTNVDLLVRSEETGRALPEATRTRMMGNMKAQMVELSTLIVDLLELSRPSRPKGSKPLEVLPLHDIVSRALDRARLRGPGLTFAVDLRPWYVRADAHAMERAVINLLDNAVKFSPPGGAIDVRLRFGTLTVRDRGPGIPAEDLPHVFDRFWRSPSARQMPGSGLGLAIVAQTVREAGGEVSLAAAEPGPDGATGGALATVQLPGAPTPPPPTPPAVAPTETVSNI